MSINGTDVSGYQTADPDYGTDQFVISKATEGNGYANPNHAEQVASARAKGLGVGHYHFLNGTLTPEAEAQYFWANCGWQPGDILAVDIEAPYFTNVTGDPVQYALRTLAELERLSGIKPLAYMNWNDKNSYAWQPLVDANNGLWGAAYNKVGFGDPAPWPFVAIWQNADTNTSGGDSNVFFGTLDQFKQYGNPGENPAPAGPAEQPTPQPVPIPAPVVNTKYTVRPGDTLGAIAAMFHVTIEDMVSWNGIGNPDLIYPGEQFTVNGNPVSAPATDNECVVEEGDTLSAIAVQFGTTVEHLVAVNNIVNPDLITPGQILHY